MSELLASSLREVVDKVKTRSKTWQQCVGDVKALDLWRTIQSAIALIVAGIEMKIILSERPHTELRIVALSLRRNVKVMVIVMVGGNKIGM